MNDIIPFNYKEHEVRTVVIDGDPWFVAKDVCAALLIMNTTDQLNKLDDDEKGVEILYTLGGHQKVSVISEPGLYSLIMRSNKPEAKAFKRWITHEVIPTIRKTGGVYMTADKAEELLADPDLVIGLAQQVKTLQTERDEAVRTKAHISDKKTASAMGTASQAVRRANKAEREAEKLRKKEEIRQGFKKFYSKFSSVCPHCDCKIYPGNAVWGEFFGPKAWGDVVHERCLGEYIHERANATDAFERALNQ